MTPDDRAALRLCLYTGALPWIWCAFDASYTWPEAGIAHSFLFLTIMFARDHGKGA